MPNETVKTDPELLEKIRKSAQHQLSPEERRNQRISLVMSVIEEDSGVTREKVERDLSAA